MYLSIAALFGFSSIVLGAFIEHGLKAQISADQYQTIKIAINYHEMHSIVILVLALFLVIKSEYSKLFIVKLTQISFILGVIFFSFSIYLSIFLEIPKLTIITPFGGTLLMLSWLLLFLCAMQFIKLKQKMEYD